MSHLTFAAAVSHSPLLAIPARDWGERAQEDMAAKALHLSDGRIVSYADLLLERGRPYEALADLAQWSQAAEICEAGLSRLQAELDQAQPDLVVIVGDDQGELFSHAQAPLIAAFNGETVLTSDALARPGVPAWLKAVAPAYGMDRVHAYPGAPGFADELIRGLVEQGVDIGVVSEIPNPREAGVGHAFGFIVERFLAHARTPIVPIFLNTFYPPNVPTPARAIAIGKALRAAIERAPSDLRIALVASGGLSHFVVDEALDRQFLDMIRARDLSGMQTLAPGALTSGSSEILNWIVVAAAASALPLTWTSYVPVYRTAPGTGCGMGFAAWGGGDRQSWTGGTQ